jgi:hypothetical protein
MAWRLANALVTLRNGVNEKWPNRDKTSDGTIGDAAHASRSSDHNPWLAVDGVGVVRALDIDVDGIDPGWYAEQLRLAGRNGDTRLTGGGYVIFNRRITTPDFTRWVAYTGDNAHTKHVHVSLSQNRAGFDRKDPWVFLQSGGFLMALSDLEQRTLFNRVMGFNNQRWYTVDKDEVAHEVPPNAPGALPAHALDSLDGNFLVNMIRELSNTVKDLTEEVRVLKTERNNQS